MTTITPALLRAAVGCSQTLADTYAEHLEAACGYFQIDTPTRLAAFLAQIGHESGSFRHTRELWGPTPAQQRYEGRVDLGNIRPGDGQAYLGRGLLQITGRANYQRTTERLASLYAPNFELKPEALEMPKWAAWSAADWWAAHGCNELADKGDFVALTKRINGGTNGLEDRQERWERARLALLVEQAHTPAPAPESPAIADPEPVAATPAPAPAEPAKTRRFRMPPFLLAALPAIIEAIPKLGKLFGSGSEVSERNLKAAELVAETVKQATGAKSEQEAVQILQNDPAAVAVATKAVEAIWFELVESGGNGIAGARKAADAYAQPDGPKFWLNPAFWISLILLILPVMLLVDVFFIHPENYAGELRTQIVTGVLMTIGMVGGFWLGTSFSSQRKTDLIARQ